MVMTLPADCCVHLRIAMLTQLGRLADAIALLEKFDATSTPGRRPGNVGLQFLSNSALRPIWYDPAIEPFSDATDGSDSGARASFGLIFAAKRHPPHFAAFSALMPPMPRLRRCSLQMRYSSNIKRKPFDRPVAEIQVQGGVWNGKGARAEH